MKARERVIKTLNCEPTDRPPIYDNIRNDKMIEYFSNCKLTIENGKKIYLKSIDNFLDCTKQFMRFPQERKITKENNFPFGHTFKLPPEVFERLEFEIEYKRWSTWVQDKSPYNCKETARKANKVINSYKGWNNWNKIELKNILEDYYQKQNLLKNTVIFACIAGVGLNAVYDFLGGLENFSYLLADDYSTLMNLYDTFFQINIDKVKNIPDSFKAEAVFLPEDIAQKNATIFSPKFLREEFFPQLEKIIDCFHKKGLRVIYDSDGNLRGVIDDLVDCGIDGLSPIETVAGMEIKMIRKRFPKLVLLGGIDCSQILPYASTHEIKKITRNSIKDASYGYFPGSTSEMYNLIPIENYLVFYNEVKKDES